MAGLLRAGFVKQSDQIKRVVGLTDLNIGMRDLSYRYPSVRLFWCLGFVYASFMALLLQKVVLPLIPEMHAGHGLLPNDAIIFHNIAAEVAERIRANGWSEWRLFPGAAGNVGVLAAIYALVGPDPAWFIPVNAAAHATGAVLIYRMGGRLCPGNAGMLGGLIAGIAFLAFPSALQWYGQNHKDAFAIAGTLLVLDAWLDLHSRQDIAFRGMMPLVVRAALGALLVGLVRPYFPVILVCALVVSSAIATAPGVIGRLRVTAHSLAKQLMLIVSVSIIALVFTSLLTDKDLDVGVGSYVVGDSGKVALRTFLDPETGEKWQWKTTDIVPSEIDKAFRRASELRVHFVVFGRSVGVGSEVDGERLPNDAGGTLAYMPRALVVGLFAPFPETWVVRVSAPRLIGAVETAIWYVFALGIMITVLRMPSRQLLAGIIFCTTLLLMLTYIHPNVGTLYRQRFGVWQFFLLCGSVGWASLILGTLDRRTTAREGEDRVEVFADKAAQGGGLSFGVDRLAASGAVVIMVTLLCYLGFLARDLLLVKQLGMSEGLDAFFTAVMIPMFFVTFLAMPMADALTLPFLSAKGAESAGQRDLLIRHMLGFAIMLLGTVAALVVVAAPQIVWLVLGANGSEQADMATAILRWFAPIILLSAWTVVGNAALNALGRSREAALGQLVVPVVTIAALIFASSGNAAVMAIAGMLFGTILNIAWVLLCLRACGIQLVPTIPALPVLRSVTLSYRRLVGAAVLTAVLIPMNYTFAASVASGAVSAWALASKIVALLSGLASVGASAVVLPHLAHLLSHGAKKGMRDDAYFLLVMGGWIGGSLAVGAVLFAEPLVGAALSGSLSQAQVTNLANIVKIGVLQLPLAISGALMVKMAIVSGASSRVLFAATLGFLCNLLVNMLLVARLGVMGVAIGTLTATAVSTLSLAVAAHRQVGLSTRELLTLFVSWLVWASVCVAVDSHSTAAIVYAALAILGMAWAQLTICRDGQELAINEAVV